MHAREVVGDRPVLGDDVGPHRGQERRFRHAGDVDGVGLVAAAHAVALGVLALVERDVPAALAREHHHAAGPRLGQRRTEPRPGARPQEALRVGSRPNTGRMPFAAMRIGHRQPAPRDRVVHVAAAVGRHVGKAPRDLVAHGEDLRIVGGAGLLLDAADRAHGGEPRRDRVGHVYTLGDCVVGSRWRSTQPTNAVAAMPVGWVERISPRPNASLRAAGCCRRCQGGGRQPLPGTPTGE